MVGEKLSWCSLPEGNIVATGTNVDQTQLKKTTTSHPDKLRHLLGKHQESCKPTSHTHTHTTRTFKKTKIKSPPEKAGLAFYFSREKISHQFDVEFD